MYSNIKVYQKYLVTSIKVGCATRSLYASSGPKAQGAMTITMNGYPMCVQKLQEKTKPSY